MELNNRGLDLNPNLIRSLAALLPAHYQRDTLWQLAGSTLAADRQILNPPTAAVAVVDTLAIVLPTTPIDLSAAATWDDLATDWALAANRAGQDFYVYVVQPGHIVLSANSTVPVGYSANNSRKIGGFHCLCVDAGVIAGHPLSGFVAGDILPASIWDLHHRPVCSPEGMAYCAASGDWVDIYLMSGSGGASGSVFGATLTDTRDWMDFADDLGAVSKRLLSDSGFQLAAAGSNEETNILDSADPGTSGGHSDTAGRRMISSIGLEDCCGVVWQWLVDQSYQLGGLTDPTTDPAWGWYDLPGAKGSLYRQGPDGDVKLLAGGGWSDGPICGSRARSAGNFRWITASNFGGRGCARSQRA